MAVLFTRSVLIGYLFSILRMSTPIIYGMLGAVVSKRAGTNNLAIEGTMLISGMVGCMVSIFIPNLLVASLAGMAAGILLSMFLAFLFLKLKANTTMTCISLNTVVVGLAMFIPFTVLGGGKGSTVGFASLTFPDWHIPFIKDIPVAGEIFSGHNCLTYIAVLATFLVWFLLFKTTLGLRIRAAGENPDAAQAVGVDVTKTKMISFVITGLLCSLGGMYMSMYYLSWFTAGQVAGRGFIGLSVSNLTGGRPFFGYMVSTLFGGIDALALTLQSGFAIPAELLQMIPYIATIIGVAFVAQLDIKRAQKKQAQKELEKQLHLQKETLDKRGAK
jgi:simple sugar transport system permease protein